MGSEVRKRLLRGFLANGFGQVVTTVIQLVSVPLFLHVWGAGLYGEWLVLSTIPVYLTMSDVGFASVAGNEMTMQAARNERQAANETFQSAWVLICALSIIVMVIGTGIVLTVPIGALLHLTRLSYFELNATVLLLALYTVVGLQSGLLYAGFRSANDYPRGAMLVNLVRLGEFLVAAVGLAFAASPVTVAALFLVARVVLVVAMARELTRRHSWLHFGAHAAGLSAVKRLTGPAFAFMAFPLGTALSMQGMLTLLAALAGPLAVVAFSTLRTLSRVVLQVMGIINNAVLVEVSAAYGAANLELTRKLHRAACSLALWLGGTSIVLLGVLGRILYGAWTGGQIEFHRSLFYWLLVVVAANGFWYSSSVVLLGINQHQRMAIAYLVGSASSLLVAFLLYPIYGLNSAAISLLMIDLFMSSYVIRRTLLITKDSFVPFVRSLLQPPKLGLFQTAGQGGQFAWIRRR